MSVHVGIIGAGGISATHAAAAAGIEGVRVVAVAGQNAAKVAALAQRYEAAAYPDADALVLHRPLDVVLIGSPPSLHAEQGIAAAHAGLHVVAEKPIDVSCAQADTLIAACRAAGVKLAVFFQDRFASDLVRLKLALDAGWLGRPLLASARVKWWRPPEYYGSSRWRGRRATDGGGAVIAQGIHTLDLLLWLLGDVASVSARQTAAVHAIEVEDTLVATLQFRSGVLATFEATTAAYPGYPRQLELTGTEGSVIVQQDRIVAADLRTPRAELVGGEASANASASSPVISDVRGHRAVIEDLLHAVKDGSEPRCNGLEGRRSLALVEALYRSAESGEAVAVTEP